MSEFDEDFTKSYNYNSDEGYFIKIDVQYLEYLYNIPNDSQFLQKIIK